MFRGTPCTTYNKHFFQNNFIFQESEALGQGDTFWTSLREQKTKSENKK